MASKQPVGNLNPTSSSTSLKAANGHPGKKRRRPHRRGLEVPVIPIDPPKPTAPDMGKTGSTTTATTTAASGSQKR